MQVAAKTELKVSALPRPRLKVMARSFSKGAAGDREKTQQEHSLLMGITQGKKVRTIHRLTAKTLGFLGLGGLPGKEEKESKHPDNSTSHTQNKKT